MDYYADCALPDRSAQLQLQAWHISSSPSWRGGFLPRLSSIPEVCEDKRVAAATGQQQGASSGDACSSAACQGAGPLQGLQRCTSTGSGARESTRQEQQTCGLFSDDSSSYISSSADEDTAGTTDPPGAGDVSAVAASTWATSIRHFTDCVPITPDSICSTSTYLSTTTGQQQRSFGTAHYRPHLPDNIQQQEQQPCVEQQHAAATHSCSMPNSNSSGSLLPGSDDAAAAASDAAVQASLLAALQELDDLEWCPWDRVTKWLESHNTAATAVSNVAPDGAQQQQPSSPDCSASNLAAIDAAQQLVNRAGSVSKQLSPAAVNAGEQSPDPSGGLVAEGAVFDAPAWWQEAVLARLQHQREAFQGSWWSRARVLASLAAARAACALQV